MSGRPWTERQLATLRKLYPHRRTQDVARRLKRTVKSVYSAAAILRIRKTAAFLRADGQARAAVNKPSHAFRFQKGHRSWNTGMKGWYPSGTEATQFKKGHRPQTWVPIGSERLNKGVLQRKITDTGYVAGDWQAVHSLIWQSIHGPVPPGHIVIFRDRNTRNFDPANLECISRAENMRRNSVHRLPIELARLVQLRGAIHRQINKRERRPKHEKSD